MKKTEMIVLVLCFVMALHCLMLPVMATGAATGDDPTAQAEPTDPPIQLPAVDPSTANDPTALYGPHTPDGRYPVCGSENRLQSSKAAVLYEVATDTLVYTWNPDEQIYPSSLTKIMTALLAIENGDLTETVTATRSVLDSVPLEALIAGLHGGEVLTLEQLLYVMMVGSANDATAVIADHIGGSQQAFVAMMNDRARELGCTGTNFVNAHGLHDEAQVTTARDMVKILRKALEYPFFKEIFGAPSYTLEATNQSDARYFQTTNYLGSVELTDDYYDSRVTGGRTGNTDEGHRNLAATAEQDGAVYITVVLEAKSEYAENGVMIRQGAFEDTVELLDLAFEDYSAVQVLYEGQVVDQISVFNGANDVVIGPREAVFSVLPKDIQSGQLTFRAQLTKDTLTAPVEAGTYVGVYQVFYGSLCIAQADLYTMNSARVSESAAQQILDPEEPGFDAGALSTAFMVLGVIFAIILVLGGGLLLVRRVRSAMGRNRNRQRRQDRRRSR